MKFTKRIISILLALMLFVSAMPVTAFAAGEIKYGIGFTTGSQLRLRADASTSSKIVDIADKGEVVVVVSKSGDWYKVIYNLQDGYMHSDYVSVLTKENAELGYGEINGTSVNLRSGPSTSHSRVASGTKGDKVYIIGLNEGWYKVIYGSKVCYIRSDYVDLTEIPYENKDSANAPKFFRGGKSTGVTPSASALNGTDSTETIPTPTPDTGKDETSSGDVITSGVSGATIVSTAKKYLGTPYVYGGASPSGFDCSGFVYYVLNSLGISVSRTLNTMYGQGTAVSKANLKPGDVVFFKNTYKVGISHVGIYVGGDQFIHAPNSRSVVSYASLNTTYWTNHYYGAVRFCN